MIRGALVAAAALAALACAQAIAQEAPQYTIELWESHSGLGMARVVGPLSAKDCAGMMPSLQSHTAFVPPDMQRQVGRCGGAIEMQTVLSTRRCLAAMHQQLPHFAQPPTLWIYNCVVIR